jgi:ring-1,2-phenylacetyl-CoA epoxidase subunit PaaD
MALDDGPAAPVSTEELSPSALLARAREAASSVTDPELPALTLAELGILRDVTVQDGHVRVTITPTYLGCPALREISDDLRRRLREAGFAEVTVQVQLTPAWTSDAITAEGRRKLTAAGIAPPQPAARGPVPLPLPGRRPDAVPCPRCGSADTLVLASFGTTLCMALHRCRACGEPFEYVKDL